MKVKTINPGTVFRDAYTDTWGYSILYDGVSYRDRSMHPSAAAAKQAMREKVAHERKRHGITKKISMV